MSTEVEYNIKIAYGLSKSVENFDLQCNKLLPHYTEICAYKFAYDNKKLNFDLRCFRGVNPFTTSVSLLTVEVDAYSHIRVTGSERVEVMT